jgi:alpha-galactosidase/6-phospho-beta-glucosidase family protein
LKQIEIAYIGGGSRNWARYLMSDLGAQDKLCGRVRLYDINKEAAQNNARVGMILNESPNVKSKWRYEAVDDLDSALKGSDFVVISILPGTFDEMETDVHLPEKYGIFQAVGDTVGPGGIMRALRTVPMYEVIARAIEKNCPAAWVINYTNPMSMCVRTLYEVFPRIKAFGCCHEVFRTQHLLANILFKERGIEGVDRHELDTDICGINHFTFITRAQYKDIDLKELYKSFVDKHYEKGYNPDFPEDEYKRNVFQSANRIKFDLFKRYGEIAAAGDRHLAEFCPKAWYLNDAETIDKWRFSLTAVSYRKESLCSDLKKTDDILSGNVKFDIFPTGEEGVAIITALAGEGDIITNINFPNAGQYANAPSGSIVETNMKVSRDKISVIKPVRLPDALNGIIMRNLYNQQAVVTAALNRDLDMAFGAFANDGLVAAIALSDAFKLFKDMCAAIKKYLPGYKLS